MPGKKTGVDCESVAARWTRDMITYCSYFLKISYFHWFAGLHGSAFIYLYEYTQLVVTRSLVPPFQTATRPQSSTSLERACIAYRPPCVGRTLLTPSVCPARCGEGTFLDMVPELRRASSEIFLAALTRQKTQLLDILCEAGKRGARPVSCCGCPAARFE